MKTINKKRRFINWHFWPSPKNFPILSVWEFLIYGGLLIVFVWLYWECQVIPHYKEETEIRQIYVGSEDSIYDCGLDIRYVIPMKFSDDHKIVRGYRNIFIKDALTNKVSVEYDEQFGNLNGFSVFKYDSLRLELRRDRINKYRSDALRYNKEWNHSFREKDSLRHLFDSLCLHGHIPKERSYFFIRSKINMNHIKQLSDDKKRESNKEWLFDHEYEYHQPKGWSDTIDLPERHFFDSDNSIFIESFNSNWTHFRIEDNESDFRFFSRPHWYSKYDLSQSVYELKITGDCREYSKLVIDFIGATQFSHMEPEPDVVTMSSIEFNDPQKLGKIMSRGLKFHATFTELQNWQSSRMFFITAFLCALLAIILTFFIISIYKISRKIKVLLLYWYKRFMLNRQRNKIEQKLLSLQQEQQHNGRNSNQTEEDRPQTV